MRIVVAALLFASTAVSGAQTAPVDSSAPYLRRGNEVERHYVAYRDALQQFYDSLVVRLDRDAPDLRTRLLPPTAVPYGYQILPALLVEQPWQAKPTHVVLSSFSWPRTDSLIDRDGPRLSALRTRLDAATPANRPALDAVVTEYLALVQDQKLIASQI